MKKPSKKQAATKLREAVKTKTAPKKKAEAPAKEEAKVGFTKLYLKSRPACRVTFRLPKEAVFEAQDVRLVGEFNDWDREATPMKRLKSGDFTVTLEMPAGRDYRFRYLIDGERWENDWRADGYVPNPHGGDDSVVTV